MKADMAKKISISIAFCMFFSGLIQLKSQNYLSFSLNAGQFSSHSFADIFSIDDDSYVSLRPFFPVQAGLGIHYYFHQKFSINTGFDFNYRYIDVTLLPYNMPNIFTGTKLYIYQVPLLFGRSFNLNDNLLLLNMKLGITLSTYDAQYQQFGRWLNTIIMSVVIRDGFFYTLLLTQGLNTAFNGKIAIDYNLNKAGKISTGVNYNVPITKNIGHELYYYKKIDTTLMAENEFTYLERDAYLGVYLCWELPFKIYFNKNKKVKISSIIFTNKI